MSPIKSLVRKRQMEIKRKGKIKLRRHLNADALLDSVRTGFGNILDHRSSNTTIPLTDTLMSGFAMFSLKDPSLLAFDERRSAAPHNLKTIYGIGCIPCDTDA